MRTPAPTLLATSALACLCALLCGCSMDGELNQGTPVAGTMRVETFNTDDYAWLPPASGTNPDPVSIDRSTLSRDHWDAYPFPLPLSGAQHYPTYVSAPDYTKATARQRGEYPTAVSSLDTWSNDSRRRLAYEGLAAPLYAAGDVLMFPIRAVMTPPWAVVVSPQGPVHLTPQATSTSMSLATSGVRPVPAGTVTVIEGAPDVPEALPPLSPPQ